MKIYGPSHYWKLKAEWEILSRESKKKANESRECELAWARVKGKQMKLQKVLEEFEGKYPKQVPIEIIAEVTSNGR